MLVCKAEILINAVLPGQPNFSRMELHAPEIAAVAQPGQFLMLSATGGETPFLKRPMGLNYIGKDSVGIIYQLAGAGTRAMSCLKAGERIELLGPCGKGWGIGTAKSRALLVGGGSGTASLPPLAFALADANVTMDIILGGQSAAHIICRKELSQSGRIYIATEDGSLGERGMVDLFFGASADYDIIYACGPRPMLQTTAVWAQERDIPCQVSLEERMGCGFGACMGCVCEHKDEDGGISYKRVCSEGPVFWAGEVL